MRLRKLLCLVPVILSISACASPVVAQGARAEAVLPPDETRLRARIAEFHEALGANDIARRYAMTTSGIRENMTFEEFKKDMRWDENAGHRQERKMTAAPGRACSCTPMRVLRCVLIVDVTVEEAGGKIIKERPLEMWEYEGGEWYWGYIGAESRGRCPGER